MKGVFVPPKGIFRMQHATREPGLTSKSDNASVNFYVKLKLCTCFSIMALLS